MDSLSQDIGHLRISRAWAGGTILNRPANPQLQSRGFFPTYSRGVHPRPAKKHQGLAPFEPFRKTKDPMVPPKRVPDVPETPDLRKFTQKQHEGSADNVVVLEALQRLLRAQPNQTKPFSEFGQARPIR